MGILVAGKKKNRPENKPHRVETWEPGSPLPAMGILVAAKKKNHPGKQAA